MLRQRKPSFNLIDRSMYTSAAGLEYARLEYTFTSRDVRLREWYLVGKRGNGKKVFIYASAAASRWDQDSPIFKGIVDSLR